MTGTIETSVYFDVGIVGSLVYHATSISCIESIKTSGVPCSC